MFNKIRAAFTKPSAQDATTYYDPEPNAAGQTIHQAMIAMNNVYVEDRKEHVRSVITRLVARGRVVSLATTILDFSKVSDTSGYRVPDILITVITEPTNAHALPAVT